MEELHPTPAAEPAEPKEPAAVTPAAQPDQPAPPRDCWADLAPGALSRDPQALLAAWMAGRAMPRRTLVRRIIGAAALIGLLACFVNACRMLLNQEQASLINIPDSFKKLIVVRGRTPLWHNEQGIMIINIFDFLLKENSLEL